MLSMPKVINFVKKKLGFPHVVIELSDSEIEEQIIFSTLNEFSKYLPHTNELVLDTMKAENKTVFCFSFFYTTDFILFSVLFGPALHHVLYSLPH